MKFIEQILSIFSLLFMRLEFADSAFKEKVAKTWNVDPASIPGKDKPPPAVPPADPPPDPPPTETEAEKQVRLKAEEESKKKDDPPPSDPPPTETEAEKQTRLKKEEDEKNKNDDDDDPNDDIYKLSDKVEIPKKRLAKIAAETRKEFGAELFDKLPEEARLKMIQKDVNIYIGSRNVNNKAQINSETEKRLLHEKELIDEQRRVIADKEKELNDKIAEAESKKKDAQKILEKNAQDIIDIDEKTTLIVDQKDAKKEIANADKEIDDLRKQVAENNARAQASVIVEMVTQLQHVFPELMTTTDPIDVQAKYQSELESARKDNKPFRKLTDDEKRAVRMQDIVMDYIKSGRKDLTITEFYHINKQVSGRYPDLVFENAQTSVKDKKKEGGKAKVIDIKTAVVGQILKDLFEQAKTDPPNPAGNTSTGASTAITKKDELKGLSPIERAKKFGYSGADA